jgi:hypothetical protein
MPRHDLQAWPIYHHRRDSIEAHMTVVFAALAVSRWIEEATGWTIRKFVRTGTPPPDDRIRVGAHILTAADLLPASTTPSQPHAPALKCALVWPS